MARFQTCPKCRALLEPGTKQCPYCSADQSAATAITPEQDMAATSSLGIWLIGACVVLYLLMVVLDPARGDREGFALEPSGSAALIFGIHTPDLVWQCKQYWRIVTANFVHLDELHLLMNCVALFFVIPLAGMTFGVHRTWVIFFLTGVLAVLVSDLWMQAGGGASGALCGMIGALGVYGKRRGGFEGRMLARRMFGWAIFILAFGILMPRVDNVAHAVGFIAGAAVGWFGAAVRARGGRADKLWKLGAYACTALLVVVAAGFLLPNVLRSRERSDLIYYDAVVKRTLSAIIRGEELPKPIAEAPESGEPVRASVNRLLELVRTGAPPEQQRRAHLGVLEEWNDWKTGLWCSHQLRIP
ncbi:MAG: rhomboid family intramembrane serine protease [Planctomycetota bacterium]|jgi:rhomboid protease GluP